MTTADCGHCKGAGPPTPPPESEPAMKTSAITWINRGRQNCKGNTMTLRDPDGTTLRTTCESCKLEYTTPVQA